MKKKHLLLLVTALLFSCGNVTGKTSASVSLSEERGTEQSVSEKQTSSDNNTQTPATEKITSEEIFTESPSTENPTETISSEDTSAMTETPTTETPEITETGIDILSAEGSLEACYFTWNKVTNAAAYQVTYKKADEDKVYTADDMLIRDYGDYMRCDLVGLAKGKYDITVKALDEAGNVSKADATITLEVSSHVREGYAFIDNAVPGAYNLDGTLKSGTKVIYITKNNAKTVKATLDGVEYTGFQAILTSKMSTGSTSPLDIRIVGEITSSDVDSFGSSSEGMQLKGKSSYQDMNTTIEGIGNDATFNGFGLLLRNCSNAEVRNLGFMNQMDDGISIDTDNSHLWVHNCDFYYGQNKGGDKAKGDGSLDTKGSTLITHSFNHFIDSGKCNLQGMKSEETTNRITYHHNWFDHSDSRHPRVRTATVHVYNNYYDGNSKYGVGATMGSSVFVENNYFRHCKYPMLTSMQGSDIAFDPDGEGTFSSEDGGSIKAYGNTILDATSFIPYSESVTAEFDAYEASSRDEKVPETVLSKQGSNAYSNFDTANTMYAYEVETPEEARETVMKYAGRTGGDDIEFAFDNDTDDTSYDLNPELVSILSSYKTRLVSIQNESEESSGEDILPVDPVDPEEETVTGDTIIQNFTVSGLDSSFFTITGNLSSSKGTVTYNDLTLTQCLKIESSTSITFKTTEKMTLTLVFNSDFAKGIYIDDTKYTASGGLLTVTLEAGSHTIKKGDTANLYYMELDKVTEA